MPLHIAAGALFGGVDKVPYLLPALKTAPWLVLLYLLKMYFSGTSNTSERNMHGKVVMVTVCLLLCTAWIALLTITCRAAQAA